MEEIEVKFLDIKVDKVEEKLKSLSAKKVYDQVFEEWIFKKPEWEKFYGRVRVRKQGKKVEMSYKETRQRTSKGNLEIEFSVGDAKLAVEFLNKLGIENVRHQQKRRIHYKLNDVFIDIDFWPKLPPYVEIEGTNLNKIGDIVSKLGFSMKDKCELDAFQIYTHIYKIDITKIKELVFK